MSASRSITDGGFAMQRQQLLRGGQCHQVGPGLVDLLHHVQGSTVDQMIADRRTSSGEAYRAGAGLRSHPGACVRRLADQLQVAINVFLSPKEHPLP